MSALAASTLISHHATALKEALSRSGGGAGDRHFVEHIGNGHEGHAGVIGNVDLRDTAKNAGEN